jgi:RHS repeat-associated protein
VTIWTFRTPSRRFSYDAAGFLVAVEAHDGSSWTSQAQMDYDGLGQRLSMTGFAGGQSLTTQYVLDGLRVLSADADGNLTTYLYGLGPIGQLTDIWAYGLPDGTGTQRQLVDPQGEITLAASYTPWGDALSVSGEGNFAYGYFGGVMDTATGLLYVGNGQYYDPSTGRFLNRNVNPNSANPYVPWSGEPTGALIGPLVLLAMLYSRKKRRGKLDTFIILLVLSVALSMSLAACIGTPAPGSLPQPSNQNEGPPTPIHIKLTTTSEGGAIIEYESNGKILGTTPVAAGTPLAKIIATACATPPPTPTGTLTPTPTPFETLSDEKNTYGLDAHDFYELYLDYKEFVKDRFGHDLTIREFLGIIIYKDGLSSGQLYANKKATDLILWAATAQLWSGYRQTYCISEQCSYGLINFITSYMESASMEYVSVVKNGNDPDFVGMVGGYDGRALKAAHDIGDEVVAPTNPARKFYNDDIPFDWGNPPDPSIWWVEIFFIKDYLEGPNYDQIFYFDKGSKFVIHSENQKRYWENECLKNSICKQYEP